MNYLTEHEKMAIHAFIRDRFNRALQQSEEADADDLDLETNMALNEIRDFIQDTLDDLCDEFDI